MSKPQGFVMVTEDGQRIPIDLKPSPIEDQSCSPLPKGPIMRSLITSLLSATVLSTAVLCAPPAVADWPPPRDPTVDVLRPVLRWEPVLSPRSVDGPREVRKVRTVRTAGQR